MESLNGSGICQSQSTRLVILSVVFGDPPVRTVTVFTTSLVLSIQVLPNVHLNFNSSRLAGPTHWFRLLFACCCRDLPSDIQECVCLERCHLFIFLPFFLSVFLFGYQLPLLCHVLQSSHLPSWFSLSVPSWLTYMLNSTSLASSFTLCVYFVMFYRWNGLRTVTKLLGLRSSPLPNGKGQENCEILVRNLEVTGTSSWFGNICRLFIILLVFCVMPVFVLMRSGVCDRAWKTVWLLPEPLPPPDDHYRRRI